MQDETFMQSALKLATKGIGSVEPNPAVGCVIVKAGQVIGRGYHRKFGGPHAEINALADCQSLSIRPDGGTMYVTLEPCCHEGKTGPCADAIIGAGLAKVVVATLDPSGHAAGRGIARLREAGIEIVTGVCEAQARQLNAPFFKFATTGRSWVILKWAQTLDGCVAYADQRPQQRWISNEASRRDAHRLRRRVGAVVVGVNTVVADNPMLTPRPSKGKKPVRVVLDRSLRIPLSSRVLTTTKTCPTIVYTTAEAAAANPRTAERITKKGVELLTLPGGGGRSYLGYLLEELAGRGIAQVLVEGGPTVQTSFLNESLVDEVCVYVSGQVLGPGGGKAIGAAMAELTGPLRLKNVQFKAFEDDVRLSGLVDTSTRE